MLCLQRDTVNVMCTCIGGVLTAASLLQFPTLDQSADTVSRWCASLKCITIHAQKLGITPVIHEGFGRPLSQMSFDSIDTFKLLHGVFRRPFVEMPIEPKAPPTTYEVIKCLWNANGRTLGRSFCTPKLQKQLFTSRTRCLTTRSSWFFTCFCYRSSTNTS